MGMETYGILFVLAALAAPVIAVALSRGRLGRKGYTYRFAAAFLLLIAAAAFAAESAALIGAAAALLAMLVLNVLIVRWTAMRLNDLQSFRWYALMWYFWPVGLVLAIVLTEKRHRADTVLF